VTTAARPTRIEKIKFLTLDELARLFRVIDDKRDRALFLLAYRHGLRVSENRGSCRSRTSI
jgi:integrase